MLTKLKDLAKEYEVAKNQPLADKIATLHEDRDTLTTKCSELTAYNPINGIINGDEVHILLDTKHQIADLNYLIECHSSAIDTLQISAMPDKSIPALLSSISIALASCMRGKQTILALKGANQSVPPIEVNTFYANKAALENSLAKLHAIFPCKEECMELLSEVERVPSLGEL